MKNRLKMGEYKNENQVKFLGFYGTKVGKYKNFFRLKFSGADLCLPQIAAFYTTFALINRIAI